MNNDLMFSSINQAWATRWEVYDQICEELNDDTHYELDPCAENKTAKCYYHFTKQDDMFSIPNWKVKCENRDDLSVFMNPEYGRAQPKFVDKLIEQIRIGAVNKAEILIPSRTDTKLFHQTLLKNSAIITFYEGRLVFGSDAYWEFVWQQEFMDMINPAKKGQKNELFGKVGKFNAAPFPSMIVSLTTDSVNGNVSPITRTLKAPKFTYGY